MYIKLIRRATLYNAFVKHIG